MRLPKLARPAAKLLPHTHRHSIHEMRTPGLYQTVQLGCAFLGHARQVLQRREYVLLERDAGTDMDGRRDHIIAALAHVDVVIRVHRCPE